MQKFSPAYYTEVEEREQTFTSARAAVYLRKCMKRKRKMERDIGSDKPIKGG